jgi:hypothetical protein|tara:strand:+ start:3359 stop:4303 length:945 start_codon:yes stop_codon:yes gene_type:complete
MYQVTIFNSIYDNKTDKVLTFDTWVEFVALLKTLSKQPGYKPKKDERAKGSSLISPAVYESGTTRSMHNATSWAGWAALDIDDYEGTFDQLLQKYSKYEYVCYSTPSSSEDKPKCRMVLNLTRAVGKDEFRHFWYATNIEFGEEADAQTKDISRMFYVPADYPDAYNFFIHNDGEVLDPAVLMDKHTFVGGLQRTYGGSFFDRLPESMQNVIVQHRKDSSDNTSYTWSSYHNCPFISKKIINEYMSISETGWYRKMYQMMVAIAYRAVAKGYPITSSEITILCKEIDRDSGNWYENRPIEHEADRAIEYVYRNV